MTDGLSCRAGPEFAARRTRSDDEVIAGHCITCGDDGTEMTVLELDPAPGLAWCAPADSTSSAGAELVEVSLVDPVSPGDRLLVHAGTAIAALPAETPA